MLVIGIILLVVAIVLIINIINDCKEQCIDVMAYASIGILIFMCFLGSMLCFQEHFDPSISPMDVYRGKTTLEYTNRDGKIIDSTVVWKEEIK